MPGINTAATTFRYFAGLARDLSGHAHHFGDSRMGMSLREPMGVASLILPWNFPIGELVWKLGPASFTQLLGDAMKAYVESRTSQSIPEDDRVDFIADVNEDLQHISSQRIAGMGIAQEQLQRWLNLNSRMDAK